MLLYFHNSRAGYNLSNAFQAGLLGLKCGVYPATILCRGSLCDMKEALIEMQTLSWPVAIFQTLKHD